MGYVETIALSSSQNAFLASIWFSPEFNPSTVKENKNKTKQQKQTDGL
jgi:hypothetical protein